MPKATKDSNPSGKGSQAPKSQGSAGKKGSKLGGIITSVLALLTALFIMIAIFGGAFYFIVKNNVNGISERYKKELNSSTFTKWMMPPEADPFDPATFTDDQLKAKYNELRQLNKTLKAQIEVDKKQLEELAKAKAEAAKLNQDITTVKNKAKAATDAADKRQKDLQTLQKKLNEMIASGDAAGFKAYFEQVDSQTAQKIYTQIMQQEKVSADMQKYVKLYEGMDAASVATLFEGLGKTKINLIAEILKNMKLTKASSIIEAMAPSFAGIVTERLATAYGIKIPAK